MDSADPPEPDGPPVTHPLALLSLACAGVSLLGCCCIAFLPFPVAGLVCGFVAIKQIDANPAYQGKPFAVGGIALSVALIVFFGVMFGLHQAGVFEVEALRPQAR